MESPHAISLIQSIAPHGRHGGMAVRCGAPRGAGSAVGAVTAVWGRALCAYDAAACAVARRATWSRRPAWHRPAPLRRRGRGSVSLGGRMLSSRGWRQAAPSRCIASSGAPQPDRRRRDYADTGAPGASRHAAGGDHASVRTDGGAWHACGPCSARRSRRCRGPAASRRNTSTARPQESARRRSGNRCAGPPRGRAGSVPADDQIERVGRADRERRVEGEADELLAEGHADDGG